MRKNRFVVSAMAALVGSLGLAAVGTAQHQHSQPGQGPRASVPNAAPHKGEEALKVGKKGEVTLRAETLVGELRLKPGRYQLQHRVDGANHFVHFAEVIDQNTYWRSGGGAAMAQPGEVNCRLEPLDGKVRATTIYTAQEGEAVRVTKVLIGGENVAHVF